MAVDKSFVVKNGLEVNSDLIVTDISDSQNKKVGIASTGPRTTLDVRGGIAATDGNFSGILTAASVDISNFGAVNGTQATITGFSTLGGLTVDQLTVSGVATFADLSYDEITGRNINITGIATIPVFVGVTSFNDGVTVAGVVTATSFRGDGSQLTGGGVGVADSQGTVIGYGFTMLNFIGAGNTFAVDGTSVDISIAGGGSGGGGSASIGIGTTVGDAFSGIVTAGNLWYNTGEGRLFIYYQDVDSAQWVDAAPFNVGIITTLQDVAFAAGSAAAPAITFNNDDDSGFFQAAGNQPGVSAAGSQVARFNPGGLTVTGVVTATSFSGDGAGLTGVASTDNIQTATEATFLSGVKISGVTTASGGVVGNVTGNLTGTADLASGLTGTPNITVGSVTAASGSFSGNITVGGTLTYQDVTNMDVLGIGTFQQGIQVAANGANITGIVTVGLTTIKSGEVEVTGVVTASHFSGGGLGVGIRTTGSVIGYGFTQLNFIGAGNTFAVDGNTVDISIAGGGGGGFSMLQYILAL